MPSLKTTLRSALPALVALTSIATAFPAAAASYPGYTHLAGTSGFAADGIAANYVACPTGQLAIASGAVNSDYTGYISSQSTTTAGNGSFAAGSSGLAGSALQTWTQCVPAATVRGFTRASLTVRDHTTTWAYHHRQVTCPEGSVAYGGGANVLNPDGTYSREGLFTYGTKPDGRGWTYDAGGVLDGRSLQVESKCLPRTRLGRIFDVSRTVRAPGALTRQRVTVGATCPDGYVAFAGGAFWHAVDSTTPGYFGLLSANVMTSNDRGWFAAGSSFGTEADLTVKVRCTDRLG